MTRFVNFKVIVGQALRFLRWARSASVGRRSACPAIILMMGLALSGSALAGGDKAKQDVGKEPVPHRHVVVVPYDGSSRVAPDQQMASRYYVDYDTFQRLWHRAKDKRQEAAAKAAGDDGGRADTALGQQDFAITSALYQATVEDKRVAIEGRLVLVTRGAAWQRVPMAFAGASVSELLIDGEPAAYEGGAILVEKPGRHEIVARIEVPIAAAANVAAVAKGKVKEGAAKVGNEGGFSGLTRQPARWGIPAAAASMLAVTMAHPDAVPVINDGLPTLAAQDRAGLFTAALGQRTEIVLGQRLSTRGRGMTQPNVAKIDSHLFVTPALERVEARYEMVFRDQEESHFSIHFDSQLTPVSLEIPNLLSWSLSDGEGDSGLRRLDFELTQPARDHLEVHLVAERLVEMGDGVDERSYPQFGANALRLDQRQSLLRVDELNVRPQVAAGGSHRQIEFVSEGVDPAGFAAVASFALSGAVGDGREVLRYSVAERPGERSAQVDYVYQVGADKVETVTQFQIRSPQSPLSEITVGLPAGSTIQAVRGNRLQEWWRNGDELFARFSGATPEVTALLVYVSQERGGGDAAEGGATRQLELREMTLPGIDEISGGGLVVAHATMDTTLRFGQGREIVREVDVQSVASDFEVLPPLERKRGFTFSKPGVTATLSLRPVEPRYDITWVLLARSFESWIKLSAQVDVAVSRSAIDRLTFSLPENVPEVRVRSPEVREVRSEVADGQRNYTVVFQRFVTDAVDFVFETEMGHAGQVSVAGLKFAEGEPSAGREERYVIVENASADRLKVNASGMNKAVSSMLPFEPENLVSPQIFRAGVGWSLDLELEDLKTTAGNDAVVMWSELTSAFRANGEEWLKVVYHLQNRSLQFMPVVLPEGAELISVSVAGESTRADRGPTADGGQAVLVPLIQTKPGQLAYDVELVMRSRDQVRRDGRAVRKLKRKLDDPDVQGIAVQRTLWHLTLPEGFELTDFDGNLEPVSDEELLLEKAEADLAEFEGLNVVAQSDEVELYSNYLAVDNGALINLRLEKTLEALDNKQSESRTSTDDSKLAKRGEQLRQRLQEQQILLTENRVQLPNFETARSGTTQSGGSGKEGGGKVGWNFNTGKLLDRNNKLAQDELAQVERLQDQLQINDNISLGNSYFLRGQAAPVEDATASVQMDQAKKTADKVAGQVGKLAEGKGGGEVDFKLRNISRAQIGHGGSDPVNASGGVVMQGEQQVRANANTGNGGFISLQSGQVNADGGTNGGRIQIGGAMQGQNQEPAQGQKGDRYGDFGNARSTNLATRSSNLKGGKGAATPKPTTGPMDPFAPAPEPGAATNATDPDPFAPASELASAKPGATPKPSLNAGRGAGQVLPIGGYQPTQGLKASGRRSVIVDFPDEGRRYHFRKIKDRAELSVEAAEPRDMQRLGWLVLFVLCLGAVVAFDAGLRQTRRAS